MRLYLVRHGESEANLTASTSKIDTPLTPKGIQDAVNAGKLLKGKFDRVFVSPYLRAIQTQQHAMPDAKAEILDCLHEIYLGETEGYPWEVLYQKYPNFREHCKVDDYSPYGGETYDQVRERAREFMQYLQSLDVENVVAFSHLGFILTFFDEVMNRPCKGERNINCPNGSISVFRFNGTKWIVDSLGVTLDFFTL